jgi:transposase
VTQAIAGRWSNGIAARGARLRHLPPYTPGFNPVEHAFSEVEKAPVRRAAACSDDALSAAAWAAF